VNLLDLTPRHACGWEEKDGRIVLVRTRPRTSGPRAILDWLAYLLSAKRLRLDDLGTFCWRQIDGHCNAWEIATAARREFGEAAEPAETRVGHFLRLLQREELVEFAELEPKEGRWH
jgi:Coenzyme PQQ synthesis protein D (PqqD)